MSIPDCPAEDGDLPNHVKAIAIPAPGGNCIGEAD